MLLRWEEGEEVVIHGQSIIPAFCGSATPSRSACLSTRLTPHRALFDMLLVKHRHGSGIPDFQRMAVDWTAIHSLGLMTRSAGTIMDVTASLLRDYYNLRHSLIVQQVASQPELQVQHMQHFRPPQGETTPAQQQLQQGAAALDSVPAVSLQAAEAD